jgi:hypothetical protein
MALRVIVLGGYGLFGKHVCLGLLGLHVRKLGALEVIIAGRSLAKASAWLSELRARAGSDLLVTQHWQARALDHQSASFPGQLAQLEPAALIHCGGPFQDQDHHVARVCIAIGAHYVDLADSRTFVSHITRLSAAALAAGVCVLSGASSVPALSSAVVNQLSTQFSRIDVIDVGISPGNRTERGLATVQAILSYCGQKFPNWRGGRWTQVVGWQRLRSHHYPAPVGKRWLVDCDVPDVGLMPAHIASAHTVQFGAGLELKLMHFGLFLLASLRRIRLLPNLRAFALPLWRISTWLERFGSDVGVMHVQLSGVDADNAERVLTWHLLAEAGAGPHVPATPAVALIKRLLTDMALPAGARTALGFFTLGELSSLWTDLPIRTEISEFAQ